MKKLTIILAAIFICSVMSYGQNSNDIVFSFIKKDSEKIMQKAKDGTQFCNFTISGIQNDEQAKILIEGFKNNDVVIEFTISDEISAQTRNAYIQVKRETKFETLREIMKSQNVAYIKINDVATKVSDFKTKAEKRAERAQDKSKP